MTIVCVPEARALIEQELQSFRALYPQATFDIRTGTSREAIQALFGARGDLAVIARELGDDERGAAVRGRLELEGYTFARDAVVFVVHPDNGVENLSLDDIRGIYEGKAVRWSAFGGRDLPIVPVIQSPSSDITTYFSERVMNGERMQARAVYQTSDSGVVAYVRGHAEATGFVSLGSVNDNVRAIRLSSLTGMPYRAPSPEGVYSGQYPLTRPFNFYVRVRGPKLASGVITYVTSLDGQKIVHAAGLVPTAVPVRFVRRSPLIQSH